MCPTTTLSDSAVNEELTYSYEITGRPPGLDLSDFARRLRELGIELGRPTAPPEFWRAIFDPPTSSAGIRINWPTFDRIWGAVDITLLAEEDSDLLSHLKELPRLHPEWKTPIPGYKLDVSDYLRGKIEDALSPLVPECTVFVEGTTIRLDPLPLVGKVRIPRAKLDAVSYDPKSDNPRLERIQRATLLADHECLHAEARRGSASPKDDQDVDHGDKRSCRCPLPSHPDETSSAWVQMYEDGFGGGCACEGFASNYPAIIRAYHPRLSREQSYDRAEDILGLPRWGAMAASDLVAGDELQALAALAPADVAPAALPAAATGAPVVPVAPVAPVAPTVPKVNHIVSWLRKQLPVGIIEEAWMVSRALDPAVQATRILSWSPAKRTTPAWDGKEIGDEAYLAEAAEVAAHTGHTLVTPTWNEHYEVVGVRFRRTTGSHKAKTRTPTVFRNKKSIPMPQAGVGLCLNAIKAGKGLIPWPEWIVITEGEPDERTAAQVYLGAAVIEIHRGKNAWTKAFADTLPNKSKIVLLTDTDKIGRKYRRDVIRSLGKRVEFYDFPGRTADLNKLLMQGKQAELDLANLKQIPVGEEREHTDLGNAHRLHDEHFGELAYADGRWYVLQDGVWERQGKDAIEVRRRIQGIAEGIVEEAEIVASEEGAKQTLWWGKKSQSSGAVSACLTEARVLFAVDGKTFDTDEFLLGVLNGVVDLRTGELLEDPGPALVSQRVHIVYDPSAPCSRWLQFLDEIFLGDKELIEYMRQCVGYFLTASTREEKFWIFHGKKGGNGKGTFLKILQKLLGPLAAPKRASLVCRREGQPSWDLSSLQGLRLAYINEAPPGGIVSVETLKNIASSDELYGEKKGVDPESFRQTHKLVWALNDAPNIPHDRAVLRRLQLVLFDACFQDNPDLELYAKLEAEIAGILAWGVSGAVQWFRAGKLHPPAKVTAAGQKFAEESDHVGRWIEDECEVAPDLQQDRTVLHTRFVEWAARQKVRAMSPTAFYAELDVRGFKPVKVRGDRYYRGIRLIPTSANQVDWTPPPTGSGIPSEENIDTLIKSIDSKVEPINPKQPN